MVNYYYIALWYILSTVSMIGMCGWDYDTNRFSVKYALWTLKPICWSDGVVLFTCFTIGWIPMLLIVLGSSVSKIYISVRENKSQFR